MAFQTSAYKASSGGIFETLEEAEMEEIQEAADNLVAVSKEHLINVATGASQCKKTRDAICRLADAIRSAPLPTIGV